MSSNLIEDISYLKNIPLQDLCCYYNPLNNIDVILYLNDLEYLDIRYMNVSYHQFSIYTQNQLNELKHTIKIERRKRIIESL